MCAAQVHSGSCSEPVSSRGTRIRRYAINPLGHRWTHHNLTYSIVQFPSSLSPEDTRMALSVAFTKWSDVSPLTFREVNASSDITIGFFSLNHSDCWSSFFHPCFDGLNGELAHAFLPPRGEIHFDNQEFWILGKSRNGENQDPNAEGGEGVQSERGSIQTKNRQGQTWRCKEDNDLTWSKGEDKTKEAKRVGGGGLEDGFGLTAREQGRGRGGAKAAASK
ncbi:hypothetical protein NQZ68_042326, partial [Dissostichus eleginoides]